jgi:hypothetical protein
MNMKRGWHFWGLVFLLANLLAATNAAGAEVRIGGWAMDANGRHLPSQKYWGPCPVNLKFFWGVIGNDPASVIYTYTRSDGVRSSAPGTLNLPAANRSMDVDVEWSVGANQPAFANFNGWVQLDIQSPNQASQKIPFALHCSTDPGVIIGTPGGRGTVRIGPTMTVETNGQAVEHHVYTGPCPVTFKFGWEVQGTEPTQINYWFDRSDGVEFHRRFTAEIPSADQPATIYQEWRLGDNTPEFANYNGWIRLNVESPTPDSLENHFLLRCKK